MLHVVLFQPEIPQNTGNVGRLCAFTGSRLHLIHPLGFAITDKNLKRSGMDYWHTLDVAQHKNWEAFLKHPGCPKRLWLFTANARKNLWQATFQEEDGLVFGQESSGSPQWLKDFIGEENCICIPRYREGLRSLNLSTSVGIGVYEAIRQLATFKFLMTYRKESLLQQSFLSNYPSKNF